MNCSTINAKIASTFAKAGPQPTRKLTGDASWSNYDTNRAIETFERLSDNPEARDGTYDLQVPNHIMAPPFRSQVHISGSLENGQMCKEDSLFLDLPVRTTGKATAVTTSRTEFSSEGVTKYEVVEIPDRTTARKLFTDFDDPSNNYVEEYIIAQ